MDTKYKVLIGVTSAVVIFAAGRYTTPEKVRIETKIVEVEKKTTDTQRDKHKETVVVEKTNPDGSKETTTTVVEDTKTDRKTETDKNKSSDVVQEKTQGTDKVTISALGGIDLTTNKAIFGGSATKPILGPITIGVFGLSNGSAGASVGLTF